VDKIRTDEMFKVYGTGNKTEQKRLVTKIKEVREEYEQLKEALAFARQHAQRGDWIYEQASKHQYSELLGGEFLGWIAGKMAVMYSDQVEKEIKITSLVEGYNIQLNTNGKFPSEKMLTLIVRLFRNHDIYEIKVRPWEELGQQNG
jgi:hypothetical protein